MDTATPCCRIALLGGLRLEQPARTTTRFQTEKTALLLAYLAHHRNQTHPREALAGQLWPDADEGAARVRLRQALASLRRQLEPPGIPRGGVLLADRRNVGLNPGAVALDVAEFEAALKAAGKAADPARRAQHLERAIALYGGRLLPGYDADWILLERERLAEAHLLALQELAALLAASGDVTRGVDCAHRAVAADPLREESRVCLMRLLLAAGQPAQALRQFRDLERLLAEAFGEAPAPELRALAERAAGQAGGAPADPPLPPPPPPCRPRGSGAPARRFARCRARGPSL
jgi:DNA-binding SARP family transcriptional activator